MDFALLKQIYAEINIPAIILGIGMIAYVLVLLKWHVHNGPFDFRASLLEPPTPGSVSLSRLAQLTALVTSTGILIYYTVRGNVSEWMYLGYMTAWAGTYIAAKYAPADRVPKQP